VLHDRCGFRDAAISLQRQQGHVAAGAVGNEQHRVLAIEREVTRIGAARSYGVDERKIAFRVDAECAHAASALSVA
jgi:hypothetical protein